MPVLFEPETKVDFQPVDEHPPVTLPDGSVATVRSIGVGDEHGEWVIPTIVSGKPVSNDEAISLWRSGKNKPLAGPFKSVEEADQFGQKFHESEAKRLGLGAGGGVQFEPDDQPGAPNNDPHSSLSREEYNRMLERNFLQGPGRPLMGLGASRAITPADNPDLDELRDQLRGTGIKYAADVINAGIPWAIKGVSNLLPGINNAVEEAGATVLNSPETLRYWLMKAIKPITGVEPEYNPPFKAGESIFPTPKEPFLGHSDTFLGSMVNDLAEQIRGMATPGVIVSAGGAGLEGQLAKEGTGLAGRLIAGYYGGEIGASLPDAATQAFDILGDPKSTPAQKGAAIARVGGPVALGALLLHGAAKNAAEKPAGSLPSGELKPTEAPNAEAIRSGEGQLPSGGIIPEGIQETGGNVVEQKPPQQPKPVETGIQFEPEQAGEAKPSEVMWSSSFPQSGKEMYLSDKKFDSDNFSQGRESKQYEVSSKNPFDADNSSDSEMLDLYDKLGGLEEAPQNPQFIKALKAKGYDSIIGRQTGYNGESKWMIVLDPSKQLKEYKIPKPPTEQAEVTPSEVGPGMGGAHISEIPTEGNPDIYGIAERVRAERAKAGQVAPVEPGEGIAAPDSVEHGRTLLENDPQAGEKALAEFERTNAITHDGMAAVRARGEQLALIARRLEEEFGTDSHEYQKAAKDLSDWDTRTKPMQTEWHKIGMAQQGETDIDTGSFTGMQRAFKQSSGKDFRPDQKETAKKIVRKVKTAEVESARADKVFNDELQTAIKEAQGRTKAEEDARAAAAKTVREAAARAAEAEKRARVADAKLKAEVERLREAPAEAARAAADRTVRNDAVRRAKEEALERVKKAKREKEIAEAERREADKALAKVHRDIRNAAIKRAKEEIKNRVHPELKVWEKIKEYTDKGETNFDDIRNKVASDLGMSVDKVTQLITRNKRMKFVADHMWRQQQALRLFQNQAKRWLTSTQIPTYQRALQAIPRLLFSLKVGFHGTVALGTHAPTVFFQPRFWKTYAQDFVKMYRMVKNKAYYERQAQDLLRRENYTIARRAGLVNDPGTYEDFNNPDVLRFTEKMTGMGNRGYAVLKILRQDMFDHFWGQLPKTLHTLDMAKAIADEVNHATGVVKVKGPPGSNIALFAPRLLASRVMWLVGDPLRAVDTGLRWKNATPEEKVFAIHQIKEKAYVLGTLYGLLVANQGLLMATNSKQRVNLTDPFRSDFLKFKFGGMTFSYGNAMLSLARLPLRLWQIRSSDGGKMRNIIYPDESTWSVLGEFGRSQLSPFASTALTLWLKADWQNRPLPGSTRPVPRRLRAQGVTPYTWPEFISETVLPIPFEEAAREVWKHGLHMDEKSIGTMMKALSIILVMGATGGRMQEDVYQGK